MPLSGFSSDILIAQNSTGTPQSTSQQPSVEKATPSSDLWMFSTFGLGLLLVGAIVLTRIQLVKASKELKFERFKGEDLKKKLNLALDTIKKMETNPDLVYAREFNLDYLRMRMDEDVFHYVIVNQIKVKVRQIIAKILRPDTGKEATVGIANTSGKSIDEVFDVTYEIENNGKWKKGVLFRIQIKLTKLPLRPSSSIVDEIIECVEAYLCPTEDTNNWQPAIEGKVVVVKWEQKAKPTPLLVLEQSQEGVNVSFRNPSWRGNSKTQ